MNKDKLLSKKEITEISYSSLMKDVSNVSLMIKRVNKNDMVQEKLLVNSPYYTTRKELQLS
jgi:hypothetical protein